MNVETINRGTLAALGFLAASVIFAGLVVVIKLSTNVPEINTDRAAIRAQALLEMSVAENAALSQVAWLDQPRGIVRLPIETAMNLAAQEGQDSARARASLKARVEKATAELPKAPEKPSAFE